MRYAPFEFTPTAGATSRGAALRLIAARWLGTVAALLALVLVVAFLALLTHPLDSGDRLPDPTGNGAWQLYHDPAGLFSLQLPARWTASVSTSVTSIGDATGSASTTTEDLAFSDPALGTSSARLYVSVSRFQTDTVRRMFCQTLSQKYNVLRDITPESLSLARFHFDTATTDVQVAVVIPGAIDYRTYTTNVHTEPALGSPPPPTPLPQRIVAADRTLLLTMLHSFQPTDPTPLSCGD